MALSELSIIKPKRPSGPGWRQGPPVDPKFSQGYDCEGWVHPLMNLRVLSAVEVVTPDPGEEALGPEYHVSISKTAPNGQAMRCTSEEATWVRQQFGIEDATEDNHVPNGVVRNFWRPVADRFSGHECPCKDDEPAIREDKGDFIWRPTS